MEKCVQKISRGRLFLKKFLLGMEDETMVILALEIRGNSDLVQLKLGGPEGF